MEFHLFREIEKFRNSVPIRSTEKKTTRNSNPWNKNRSKLTKQMLFQSILQKKTLSILIAETDNFRKFKKSARKDNF